MLYHVCRAILRIVFKIIFRYQVIGHEHVPTQGAVVLCANHISNFDPPMLGCAMDRAIHFMAKAELFRNRLISYFLYKFYAFPVRRGARDQQAIQKSLEVLRNEQVLGIFPEGTRSRTGKLGRGHIGAALVALKTGAPIVPVSIIGPYRIFRKVKIVFGKPIDVTPYRQGKVEPELARSVIDQVMEQIQRNLDQYR